MKAPVAGLVHRQGAVAPTAAFLPVVNAGIISANWKDLQPTKGGPLVTGPIDSALAAAESHGQVVKLKVYAGRNSPAWVINLGGTGGVALYDPPDDDTAYKVPRWWTSAVGDAYEDLQAKLAAKYEGRPSVSTVQASMTGVLFAEPFLRVANLQQNVNRLVNAGFTAAKDDVAIRRMIAIHANWWPTTRMDLACHPYQRIDAATKRYVGPDQDYTRSIMDYARTLLGSRCQFGYTALGKVPAAGTPEAQMFDDFAALGGPLWFQTATLEKLGGTCEGIKAALDEGVMEGGQSVELPAGYDDVCTPQDLASHDAALEAHVVA